MSYSKTSKRERSSYSKSSNRANELFKNQQERDRLIQKPATALGMWDLTLRREPEWDKLLRGREEEGVLAVLGARTTGECGCERVEGV